MTTFLGLAVVALAALLFLVIVRPFAPPLLVLARNGLALPRYAYEGDSGLDLPYAGQRAVTIEPLETTLLPTGMAFLIPVGYEGQVRPRSNTSLRAILVHLGTIDRSYVGEVSVIVTNLSHVPVVVRPGDRLAQLVVAPVARCAVIPTRELPPTTRGAAKFGSTGA